MPTKKPDAPEEVNVFESIKNRIAQRSQVIADLRQTVADKDEEILQMGVRVEDAETAQRAALALGVAQQTFIDSIKALPEFADLFQAEAEAPSDGDQPA